MKISEIITDKYKLRMPPTVYYELLADVVEAEEEQEPKTGHWRAVYQGDEIIDYRCSECEFGNTFGKGTYRMNYCPNCGIRMEE